MMKSWCIYHGVIILTIGISRVFTEVYEEYPEEFEADYFSKETDTDESGDYYYDYYEDQDESSDPEEADDLIVGEEELSYLPKMLTKPTRLHASVGEDVYFDCDAENSSEFVRIWMKDDKMLFTGNVVIYRSDRYSLEDSRLKISKVSIEDSGIYTCSIMVREEELSVRHDLNVTDSFFIRKTPKDGNLEIEAGKLGRLSCVVSNLDKYTGVEWSRDGQPFQNGNYTFVGNELSINNASTNDAGRYYCFGRKTDGQKSSTSSFLVKVLFPPRILSLEKATFKTGEGFSLELTCTVIGQPSPKVTWYKGNEVVSLDGRVETQNAGSRHVLIVNRVQSNDIGVFMCYSTNDGGNDQKQISFLRSDYEARQDKVGIITSDSSTESTDYSERSISKEVLEKMKDLEESLNTEKKTLLNFRKGIEEEMNTLRDLTYSALNDSRNFRSDSPSGGDSFADTIFENAILEDIERIRINLRRLEQTYENQIQRLSEFSSEAKDDFLRLWDRVNELQEVTNQTTGNIEEIYDKDIQILQNFRNDAKNDIAKLRFEINTFLEEVQNLIYLNSTTFDTSEHNSEIETQLRKLDVEFRNVQSVSEKLKDDIFIVGDELKGVHQDLDAFKKFQRNSDTLHLKIGRRIDKIIEENLVDLEHRTNYFETKINDFDEFRERIDTTLRNKAIGENKKASQLTSEVQKMKNQIYYLQQSILHLRSVEEDKDNAMESSTSSFVTVEQFSNHVMLFNKRDKEYSQAIFALQDKIRSNQEESLADDVKDVKETLKKVLLRLDNMETESKKYNLIITGIRPSRRLERANHLEHSVKEYFQNHLNLTDVKFADIERIRNSRNDQVRVKFSGVTEKFRILRLSRTNSDLRVNEDFGEAVILARRKLTAFARKRSTRSKRKWALKYDELYYNGRIFKYDSTSGRIVPKNL